MKVTHWEGRRPKKIDRLGELLGMLHAGIAAGGFTLNCRVEEGLKGEGGVPVNVRITMRGVMLRRDIRWLLGRRK